MQSHEAGGARNMQDYSRPEIREELRHMQQFSEQLPESMRKPLNQTVEKSVQQAKEKSSEDTTGSGMTTLFEVSIFLQWTANNMSSN